MTETGSKTSCIYLNLINLQPAFFVMLSIGPCRCKYLESKDHQLSHEQEFERTIYLAEVNLFAST